MPKWALTQMKVKLEFSKCMGIMMTNLNHLRILNTTVLSGYGSIFLSTVPLSLIANDE